VHNLPAGACDTGWTTVNPQAPRNLTANVAYRF